MRIILLLLGLSIAGCVSDSGVTLQLTRSILPSDGECVFSTDNASISGGAFDPSAGISFVLGLEVKNNAASEEDDPSEGFNGENTRPRVNDVLINGFETCFYRSSEAPPSEDASCEDFPEEQRAEVASSVTVERQGTGAVSLSFLTLTQLRSLYGNAFTPEQIPIAGANGSTFSYGAESASTTTRSAAWGSFPEDDQDPIVVQVRALGKTQGGTKVKSNWFRFPVTVCIRCFGLGACGLIAENSACGEFPVPTLNTTNSCLPYQGIGTVTCTLSNPCP